MDANKSAMTKRTTVAFRTDFAMRYRLEAIQHERGHAQLSETLREAIAEYITRHSEKAA